MSLDVTLTMPGETYRYEGRIFVRDDGQRLELSRDEWNERFPDREPMTIDEQETDEVFSANITHNLTTMADEAGIYKCLWRPDELGMTKAKQLIAPLRFGLELMQREPERFKKLNPSNGWGSYDRFVPWIAKYLAACEEYPEADVRVCR